METTALELFKVVFAAALLAMATWSAMRWTVMSYLQRRMWKRAGSELPPIPVDGANNSFARIMEAQEELNLTALDVPDAMIDSVLAQGGEPWLLRIAEAIRGFKKNVPESNQRAMRAMARDRAKFKGTVDTDDADAGP